MWLKMFGLIILPFLCLTYTSVHADIPVVLIDESSLPYDLAPSNYSNSENNYANSVLNYANSPNNYANSENNYANSASNYSNGVNERHRLIYNEGGTLKFVGYYVSASNGVTNFFSPDGHRIFYNPKNGRGVYGGEDGTFCGVLAAVSGQFSLALTERGMKVLFLTQ